MRWFVPKLLRRKQPHPRLCPVCDLMVEPGFQCSLTICPWELDGRDGKVILHDPLRLRIH